MGRRGAMGAALAAVLAGAPLTAQVVPAGGAGVLTLEEALELAEGRSEEVAVARAGVLRARGDQLRARSERFPQLTGFLSYDRALASEFEGAFGGGEEPDSAAGPPPGPVLPPCQPYFPDPSLTVAERLAALERAVGCEDPGFGGFDFENLPFGRENTYRLGLSLSQSVYAGGRIAAQNRIATSSRDVAEIALQTARAQLVLDVSEAYYNAALTDRLVAIAEATLEQAETTLRLTRLAREVGNQPEFELLRAQVTASNQRPVVIQRRAERDQAYLRLKQLLELPAEQELRLEAALDDEELAPLARFASGAVALQEAAERVVERAPVRQAREAVEIREAGLRIARSQRLPNLGVSSAYSRVAYPADAFPTALDQFRTNWTVTATLSVPIFSGGRVRGDVLAARADLQEAEARLAQARELALLDTRGAYEQLEAALASWEASQGTVDQAARAYQIADLRYREGISTQVELTDSRIQLQLAQANRAQAARDLQIARIRVALLPDLPLGGGVGGSAPGAGAAGGAGGAGQGGAPARAPAGQGAPTQRANTSFTGAPGGAGR